MMRILHLAFLVFLPVLLQAQTQKNGAGNWNVSGSWASSNIGDVVTESVILNSNTTVPTSTSYTVGATTLNSNFSLVVSASSTLNIGDATHPVNFTTNMNANITVTGTMIIWGDFFANSNISNLTVSSGGTLIIKGNLKFSSSGTNLNINGTLTVGGNFGTTPLATNVNVNVNGPNGKIDVAGSVNLTNSGSNLNSCAGCFKRKGACNAPPGFCSNTTLPITLASFKAIGADQLVQLDWTTASEENFDKFIVERSSDGKNFEYLTELKGAGNSKLLLMYNFADSNPLVGRNYYRLKSVDFDLQYEYSNVVLADFEGKKIVRIYPNPTVGNSVEFQTNFVPKSGDRIELYDNLGLRMMDFAVTDHGTNLQFNSPLKRGAYLFRYVSDDHTQVIRFYCK